MDKNFESYNRQKQKAVDLLVECINRDLDKRTISVLEEKRRKLEQDRFVVSVFGHFSNGKSTFLNALMGFGYEVLKEDDVPSTATVTRLRYADVNDGKCDRAEVIYRNGKSEWISREELNSFVARNNEINVEEKVREVILYLNSPFLRNGVEIVDTPGFNSTYQMHTEIALQQVEKSDAAIFLFSCEKPGNSEELEFLHKVSRYMKRIFFVLNKLDCSSDGGKTERESIYRKMEKRDIHVEGKTIYSLSAKRAKEAIADENKEKMIASGLPKFEEVLAVYLTSEDNVRDRLMAPLHSVRAILEKEREYVGDQIASCSKDRNELAAEIRQKRMDIESMESELSDKKKHIASSVKNEVYETRREVNDIVSKVKSAQSSRLSNIRSKFDIRLHNFETMNMEIYLMFSHEWEDSATHLEHQLLGILDTSVDSQDDYEKISKEIGAAIRSHLQLEQINVDKPDFDFTELARIDEEIKKAKVKYDEAYDKASSLYAAKDVKDNALMEIENLKKNLERLRNQKEKRIEILSMVQVEYGSELKVYDKYVKRSRIGQFFLGDKRIERVKREDYIDDRAKKAADEEISQIEKEINKQRLATEEQVNAVRQRIEDLIHRPVDREIAKAEREEQAALETLMKKREREIEERRAAEKQIICVEKDKYLLKLNNELEEMGKNIKSFLDRSQSNFISILTTALDAEASLIEKEKNNIEKMVSINNKSSDEMDQELIALAKESEELKKCLVAVERTEEEIHDVHR